MKNILSKIPYRKIVTKYESIGLYSLGAFFWVNL